jgi:GDP-4-dehydro-6-deoxy-D-mannose reductase
VSDRASRSRGPVLVTGGAGFVGSHLIERLQTDLPIVAWTRATPPGAVQSRAAWQNVDILDAGQVAAAIRDVRPSAIFHLAGIANVGGSWARTSEPLEVNVLGTHRLFEAVRTSGVRCRILVSGSAHVYATAGHPLREDDAIAPASPYALSKLAQEQLAVRAAVDDGLDVVITRSFNHTGARQTPSYVAPSIARQIAEIERGAAAPVIRVGNLDAVRDLLDVRDVVDAYAMLMATGETGTIYNVASGVGRPIRVVLDALVARARVPIRVETDPARLRPSDVPVLVGDASRLRKATGWQPAIPFEQLLDDLLDFWRRSAD